MNDFNEKIMDKINISFNETKKEMKKLPDISEIKRAVSDKINEVSCHLKNFAIKIPVSVKVNDNINLVYMQRPLKRDVSGIVKHGDDFEILVLKNNSLKKINELKDDQEYLSCALKFPALIKKLRKEADKLKKTICEEIANA